MRAWCRKDIPSVMTWVPGEGQCEGRAAGPGGMGVVRLWALARSAYWRTGWGRTCCASRGVELTGQCTLSSVRCMPAKVTRRDFLGAAVGTVAASTVGYAAPRSRPNVLFILADDLGYGDLSCYGR